MIDQKEIESKIGQYLQNKYNILFGVSLLFSVWFFFTCALWEDFVNITLSYPFGIIALFTSIAGVILDSEKKKYTIIHLILTAGVLWAMVVLMFK